MNTLILIYIFFLVVYYAFSLDKEAEKHLNFKIRNMYLFLLLPLLIILKGLEEYKIPFLVNLILLTFVTWAFITGFKIKREYIYGFSLIFLIASPILIKLGYTDMAEYSAATCFLLMILGVTKDIFYEKIFK